MNTKIIKVKGKSVMDQEEFIQKYNEERDKLRETTAILAKLKPEIERELMRTGELSRRIGEALNIQDEEYYLAGYYANLGFLGIENFILDKRRINKQEYELIKRHPIISAEILEEKELHRAAQFALYHHEKPNGTGYFRVTNYPKECAYINIADRFQSYITHQIYRPKFTLKEAIDKALKDYRDYIFISKDEIDAIEPVLKGFYEVV
ncbi:HD domain-containing protein [Campylobacter sp. MIT 97-5078]|nr:hypothetical protein LR59_12110 [Campylobacter sp. MIT 97-5078]TQR27423.1 HD domain-containing protein [Campylobacter sp. MIT 97-5078]